MAAATVLQFPTGSLYQIEDHLSALYETLDACPPEQRAELETDIERYLEAEVRKVDGIAAYMAHCEAQMSFAADEIKRLQERKGRYSRQLERMKDTCVRVMEQLDKKRLEGRTTTFSLRAMPVREEALDESVTPERFKRTEVIPAREVVTIDRRAIKAALEAGEDVPGWDLAFGRSVLVRR